MDLEKLDREELEARAARLGVDNPQHKTRRQLIQAIGGSSRSTASRTLDAAKSLFELAATVARTLRPTRPMRPQRPPEGRPTVPLRPAPEHRATVPLKTDALKKHNAEVEAEEKRQRDTVAQETDALVGGASSAATVRSKSSTSATPTTPSKTNAALEAAPPSGRDAVPSPPVGDDEPIMTQTMARLLDQQGHHKRALAIYDTLVRQRPDDADLKREQEGARTRTKGKRPRSATTDEAENEEDAVLAIRIDDSTALVSWQLDADALEQARETLESGPPLTARALIVSPSDTEFVRRELRTMPAEIEGVWLLSDLPTNAHASVAVGWELDSGFRSHAHARTLSMS